MNYTAKDLLQKFSTKKDALQAVQLLTNALSEYGAPAEAIQDLVLHVKEIENYQDKDLATQVLELFNEVNNCQYRNDEKIRAIIRNQPKATFDQFASIIYHKKETWGTDPKMREYLRPATLFGSVNKFKTYLDDATNYWIKKPKPTAKERYEQLEAKKDKYAAEMQALYLRIDELRKKVGMIEPEVQAAYRQYLQERKR